MGSKGRLIVCPVDIDTAPIARYSDMLQEYSLQGVVSPTGWGYGNMDTSFIDGGPETGIRVTDDFEQQLDNCDAVLFSSSYNQINFQKYLLPKIEMSVARGKEILLSLQTDDEIKNQIEGAIKNRCNAVYINRNDDMRISPEYIRRELLNINTPVVLVTGLGERCNKFETQLSLRKYFLNLGYNVCQLGTKGYSSLFGFKAMPEFLYDNTYNTEEKIYIFNNYVRKMEKDYNPDVFIIGVPGGIMSFDNIANNHFAMMAYIISNAVTPDSAILSLYYGNFTDEYFGEMQNYCRYKFGFNVSCFNIANTKYSVSLEDKSNYLSFLSLNSDYVMNNISESVHTRWKLYNIYKDNGNFEMPEYIFNLLTGNIGMVRNA